MRVQTSCRSVVHIGDSLSVGLVSAALIPDEEMQHRRPVPPVGVPDVRLEISGARSVIEHLDGQLAGEEVARRLRRNGFEGCWVVALGTNDAANVAVGSGHGYSDRIDRMMAIIGDDPVVWVDIKTQRDAARTPARTCAGSTRRWPRPTPGIRSCTCTTGRARSPTMVRPRRHPLHERRLRLPLGADRRRARRRVPGVALTRRAAARLGRSDGRHDRQASR